MANGNANPHGMIEPRGTAKSTSSIDHDNAKSDSRSIKFSANDETLNLDCLNARELFMMTRRFGLDGEPPQTLAEMAELFDVSRETARQTVLQATEKLKDAARLGRL